MRKHTKRDQWTAAAANDLATKMTTQAIAQVVAEALSCARSYEALNTPAGDAAADALRKFADRFTG